MALELTVADGVMIVGLAIASWTDVREEKIYNALTFPLMAAGVVVHSARGDVWFPLLGIAVAFGIHFALWSLKVERGGDAKLMMGVGALLGWSTLCEASLWMYLLLFPVGLTVLWMRGRLHNFIETVKFVAYKARGFPVEPPAETTTLPFGPVIACAVIVARTTDWLMLWEQTAT